MLTSVFIKTLRDQQRGLIGWALGTALTVVVMGAVWPSFSDVNITALMDQYPEALKEAFNIAAMDTGAGYLNAELFSLMLPAIFIIFGVARGARLIAGEEEDGTLELLATLPVSRRRILLEKAGALIVELAVLALVLLASVWVASLAFGLDIAFLHAVNGAISMFFIGLEFGLVSLALSAATGRRGLAVGVSAGLAGLAYLLYLVAQLVKDLRPLRFASPFYQAISEGPIGPNLPALTLAMVAVGGVALAVSLVVFDRRDLGS
ncbi:MAG: ABC transporter permease subunit [Actinobacteria bacterium]|nr:ABC transporter permease subunit [Actinomycetota bacterium]